MDPAGVFFGRPFGHLYGHGPVIGEVSPPENGGGRTPAQKLVDQEPALRSAPEGQYFGVESSRRRCRPCNRAFRRRKNWCGGHDSAASALEVWTMPSSWKPQEQRHTGGRSADPAALPKE